MITSDGIGITGTGITQGAPDVFPEATVQALVTSIKALIGKRAPAVKAVALPKIKAPPFVGRGGGRGGAGGGRGGAGGGQAAPATVGVGKVGIGVAKAPTAASVGKAPKAVAQKRAKLAGQISWAKAFPNIVEPPKAP